MPIDISNLRIELRTGPFAAAYSANILAGNHNGLATTLNTRQAIGSSIVVGLLRAVDLQPLVVGAEYMQLNQAQRDLWAVILTTAAPTGLAISTLGIRSQLGQVWSASTSTRSNLSAAQIRSASRAEALFGEGAVVDVGAIHVALTQ